MLASPGIIRDTSRLPPGARTRRVATVDLHLLLVIVPVRLRHAMATGAIEVIPSPRLDTRRDVRRETASMCDARSTFTTREEVSPCRHGECL
jgi:hypothetical protein